MPFGTGACSKVRSGLFVVVAPQLQMLTQIIGAIEFCSVEMGHRAGIEPLHDAGMKLGLNLDGAQFLCPCQEVAGQNSQPCWLEIEDTKSLVVLQAFGIGGSSEKLIPDLDLSGSSSFKFVDHPSQGYV